MFNEEVEILFIEEVEEETDVYDITVEDDESFIAEGIVVHNCPQCASLDGRLYKFENGEIDAPRAPIHPFCFINPDTSIYTNKGPKPIVEIKNDDMVLTHMNRFRRVTDIVRHESSNIKLVLIKVISSGPGGGILELEMTGNHPILVNGRWKKASSIRLCDKTTCLDNYFIEGFVINIERRVLKENKLLYNFSVEEDESYIANGIVSHNCRCVLNPVTKSWKELGAKIPPGKEGASKAFLGNPLEGQLTYSNWLKQQGKADQIEMLGKARYDLWSSGKIQLNQMATQKGVLRNVFKSKPGVESLESLTQKQLKGLGAEIAGPKPSSMLSAEVRAQMSARQIAAIDNYIPSDKKSRGVAELTERQLAKNLGIDHIVGKRPFDMFYDNEFVEVKTLIQGRGQIRIRPPSMEKKTAFIDKYKVRPHTVLVDKRPGSETFGKIFYRKGLGDFRPSTMTEVKDMEHLRDLLKKGAKKTDYNLPAVVDVATSKSIKQAETWAVKNLGIKEVDYDELDKKAGDLVNKYLGGAIDRLGVKPGKVYWDDTLFTGKNSRIAALAQEDGSLVLNRKYFMTQDIIGSTVKDSFKVGQFGTASEGHIIRHEMGHLQYFNRGGSEALATKKLTPNMINSLKDIGEENLSLYVSKYARKNQGEFYAEMYAKLLNGEQLHPVVKNIMRDIEKGIKKGVVGKVKKTKGVGVEVRKLFDNIDNANNYFYNNYKISGIKSYDLKDKDLLEKFMPMLRDSLDDMHSRFPKLGKVADKNLGYIEIVKGRVVSSGATGEYDWAAAQNIKLASSLRNVDTLKIGGKNTWATGNDFYSNFRHEYGHHLHRSITGSDLSKKWGKEIWKQGENKSLFKSKVSNYSSTDYKEAFAECFSAFTSPKYKQGMLPKEVEDYFIELMGNL